MKIISYLIVIICALTGSISFAETAMKLDYIQVEQPNALLIDEDLLEGTEVHLSNANLNEILPWATNTAYQLRGLLDSLQYLDSKRSNEELYEGIANIVYDSAAKSKNDELFMRYILNRGLVVYRILIEEADLLAPGMPKRIEWVLKNTIQLSLEYSGFDIEYVKSKKLCAKNAGSGLSDLKKCLELDKNRESRFSEFGAKYFNFLHTLNLSIVDASAQFEIEKFAIGLLHWDLYRDKNNDKNNASFILEIHNALNNTLNRFNDTDKEMVQGIRVIKRLQAYKHITTNNSNVAKSTDILPMITCVTFSNGRTFKHKTRDKNLSVELAINACTSGYKTVSNSCHKNISCDDGLYYPPVLICATESNGHAFYLKGRDRVQSSELVVAICKSSHHQVINAACEANVYCEEKK